MFLCYKCGLDHCKILSNTITEKCISLSELQEYKLGQWDREIKRICKERTAADFLMSNHVHHGHISCISIRRGALISRGHHKMASSLSLLLSSPASLIAVCVDIGTFYTTLQKNLKWFPEFFLNYVLKLVVPAVPCLHLIRLPDARCIARFTLVVMVTWWCIQPQQWPPKDIHMIGSGLWRPIEVCHCSSTGY